MYSVKDRNVGTQLMDPVKFRHPGLREDIAARNHEVPYRARKVTDTMTSNCRYILQSQNLLRNGSAVVTVLSRIYFKSRNMFAIFKTLKMLRSRGKKQTNKSTKARALYTYAVL